MKNSKRNRRATRPYSTSGEREARHEIRTFLSALASYADRFACDPHLSFEQHLFRIVSANPRESDGVRHRG